MSQRGLKLECGKALPPNLLPLGLTRVACCRFQTVKSNLLGSHRRKVSAPKSGKLLQASRCGEHVGSPVPFRSHYPNFMFHLEHIGIKVSNPLATFDRHGEIVKCILHKGLNLGPEED